MKLKIGSARALLSLAAAGLLLLSTLGVALAKDDDEKHEQPPNPATSDQACDTASLEPSVAGQGQCADKSPDADFVRMELSGNTMEVTLGEMAQTRASSADVKQFGQRMIQDHGKALQETERLAVELGVDPQPGITEDMHRALVEWLSQFNGQEFDHAYIAAMVPDHRGDIADYQDEVLRGREDVASYAAATLPILEQHLQMATDIAAKLGITPGADHP